MPTSFRVFQENIQSPWFFGRAIIPERPFKKLGGINIFETAASSRYDSLQLQVHGRLRQSMQYQLSYNLSKATDDVSDVFDLAGASALPQNSFTFAGERGPANFDARHRFTYNFIYTFADYKKGIRSLLSGLQIASIGRFQTGQPFTVNSTIDVNLDGNLTDRLNTLDGIIVTGDRSQPLRLTTEIPLVCLRLLVRMARSLAILSAPGTCSNSIWPSSRVSVIGATRRLIFRTEIFNVINRANFGVPVRFLEAPGFGKATSTVTPGRRVQFSLKFSF